MRRSGASSAPRKLADGSCVVVVAKLEEGWSPERVSGRLRMEDPGMAGRQRIYDRLRAERRKSVDAPSAAGKRNLQGGRHAGRGHIPGRWDISECPKEVGKKARTGDWKADTVIGKGTGGVVVSLADRCPKRPLLQRVDGKKAEVVGGAMTDLLRGLGARVHTITLYSGREFAEDLESLDNDDGDDGPPSPFSERRERWRREGWRRPPSGSGTTCAVAQGPRGPPSAPAAAGRTARNRQVVLGAGVGAAPGGAVHGHRRRERACFVQRHRPAAGLESLASGKSAETMLRERVDEVEKAGWAYSSNGARLVLAEALLPLMEPMSAREWNCPFFQVPFDMSWITWVMAANSLRGLPGPLPAASPAGAVRFRRAKGLRRAGPAVRRQDAGPGRKHVRTAHHTLRARGPGPRTGPFSCPVPSGGNDTHRTLRTLRNASKPCDSRQRANLVDPGEKRCATAAWVGIKVVTVPLYWHKLL